MNKFTLVIGGISVLSIVVLFFLYRNTSVKLNTTRAELAREQLIVDTLQRDNARLVEFNKRRDEETAKIRAEYAERLKAIPADPVGDMRPSQELLDFLKRG